MSAPVTAAGSPIAPSASVRNRIASAAPTTAAALTTGSIGFKSPRARPARVSATAPSRTARARAAMGRRAPTAGARDSWR